MKHKLLALLGIVTLLAAFLTVVPAGAANGDEVALPIAVDIDHRLKNLPAPAQPNPEEADALAALGATDVSQCFGDGETLVITITSRPNSLTSIGQNIACRMISFSQCGF